MKLAPAIKAIRAVEWPVKLRNGTCYFWDIQVRYQGSNKWASIPVTRFKSKPKGK